MSIVLDKQRRIRFSLRSFLLLQLLIAPAFLGPIYYDLPERGHPYVIMLGVLLAPACYVAVFASRKALRMVRDSSEANRPSIVFAAVRSGILFGLLFGALALSSLGVLWFRDCVVSEMTWSQILVDCANVAVGGALILLHYLVIGGATGGLAGLAVDVWSRGRFGQVPTRPRDAQ